MALLLWAGVFPFQTMPYENCKAFEWNHFFLGMVWLCNILFETAPPLCTGELGHFSLQYFWNFVWEGYSFSLPHPYAGVPDSSSSVCYLYYIGLICSSFFLLMQARLTTIWFGLEPASGYIVYNSSQASGL